MVDNTQTSKPEAGPATRLMRSFVDHPASVGETYFEHMRFAFGFAGSLFVAGGAALVHAFIPGLCETTASRKIKDMHARLSARH